MKTPVKIFLIVGLVLLVGGVLCGVSGTVLGMLKAFSELGHAGVANTDKLSVAIGTTLMSTAIGIMVSIFGLFVVVASLIVHATTKTNKKT